MKLHFSALCLAFLGSIGALVAPVTAEAGNVGYYQGCFSPASDKAPLITQSGNTPVAVPSLTTGNLSSLKGLVVESCNGTALSNQVNADVLAAVVNGMTLVIYDWNPERDYTLTQLPGSPASNFYYAPGAQIDLAASTPIATGPGGTLTNASLDGGNSSNHGFALSLSAGAIPLLTTADASQVVAFSYMHGAGRIIYSAIPLDCYLSNIDVIGCNAGFAPGVKAYFANVLAWGVGSGPPKTCSTEGYTGTKLTWCQNICEKGYTGGTLDIWIQRWVNKYRDLPYCAR